VYIFLTRPFQASFPVVDHGLTMRDNAVLLSSCITEKLYQSLKFAEGNTIGGEVG